MTDQQKQLKMPAVCDGEIIDISKSNDIIFSEKMIGDGYAMIPSGGNIYAVVDGIVSEVAATKHAFYITLEDDNKVLIHIGEDTLFLKGEGFTVNVDKGSQIKTGDLLGTIDLAFIKDQGYDVSVSVIFLMNKNLDINVQSYPQKKAIAKETLACDIAYKPKNEIDS